MTTDSLFSALGITIAVIALLPAARRKELALRFNLLDYLAIAFVITIVHYVIFINIFKKFGLTPGFGIHNFGLKPGDISYAAVILLATFLFLRYKSFKLKSSRISRFVEFVDLLISQKLFSEATEMILNNYNSLIAIGNYNYLTGKIYKSLCLSSYQALPIRIIGDDGEIIKRRDRAEISISGRLVKFLLPDLKLRSDIVTDFFDRLCIRVEYSRFVAMNNPYFGIKLLNIKTINSHVFANAYFTELMEYKQSSIYYELFNTQNRHGIAYVISPKSELLHWLFLKSKNAEKIGVWDPIGEFVLNRLNALLKCESDDYLELPDNFSSSGKWDSELYIGIQFFDVMISSALDQGIRWHMWLYYYCHFWERIDRNLKKLSQDVTTGCEWRSSYHYLLYCIISNLCGYIEAIIDLPLEHANVILEDDTAKQDNGNIVTSSMICVSRIVRSVLKSENLSEYDKSYYVESVLETLFRIEQSAPHKRHFEFFKATLRKGGSYIRNDDTDYRQLLSDHVKALDTVHFDETEIARFIEELEEER